MFPRLFILIVLVSFGCSHSQFDCPKPESVRLKRKAGVNYKVLMARQRQEAKGRISRAELKQLTSRELKTVTVEEWDCPRPGVKNVPKQVQENIRKNKKKFNEYYKTRNSPDSLGFSEPNR